MKVMVRIVGCSDLPAGMAGEKKFSVVLRGKTAGDLIHQLSGGMDREGRDVFLGEQGAISSDLSILVNGIMISDSNRGNFRLKEGDTVELISSPG